MASLQQQQVQLSDQLLDTTAGSTVMSVDRISSNSSNNNVNNINNNISNISNSSNKSNNGLSGSYSTNMLATSGNCKSVAGGAHFTGTTMASNLSDNTPITSSMSALASKTIYWKSLLPRIQLEPMLAGIAGGVTSTLILHPLDLLKIRLSGELLSSQAGGPSYGQYSWFARSSKIVGSNF